MSRLKRIRALVENGLYYLTEHADDEAQEDDLDIYDIESAILGGRVRRMWPRGARLEILGESLDGRRIGIVCRLTRGNRVCVVTVYEDDSSKG